MDIHFRFLKHHPVEAAMGHVYWFRPASGCDGISATANTDGFTPLMAIATHFNWDRDVIKASAAACGHSGEVVIVSTTPTLFLVPATRGESRDAFLVHDLVAATRAAGVRVLHFTHFGFIQRHLPKSEISTILNYLFAGAPSTKLDGVVFDVDERVQREFYALLRSGVVPPSSADAQ